MDSSITQKQESSYYLNIVSEETTIDQIRKHMEEHGHAWLSQDVIWDLSRLNFSKIDVNIIRSFVLHTRSFVIKRAGKKTAWVVNSEHGFGMISIMHGLAINRNEVNGKLFKDLNSAIEWIKEDKSNDSGEL